MRKLMKMTRLDLDAGEPRRFRVAADGIELRAEAGAAHQDVGGDGADGDEHDEVRHALPRGEPDRGDGRDKRRQQRAGSRSPLKLRDDAERHAAAQLDDAQRGEHGESQDDESDRRRAAAGSRWRSASATRAAARRSRHW